MTSTITTADTLTLYGTSFPSRVLLGTSRYPSLQSLSDSIDAARPGMVTVALRRQSNTGEAGFFDVLKRHGVALLPNTAGCQTVDEVLTTAHMARELFDTPWLKLELIGDDYTLQPGSPALKLGFVPFDYSQAGRTTPASFPASQPAAAFPLQVMAPETF